MSWGGGYGYGWRPYVPVGQRLANAAKRAAAMAKKQGRQPSPVKLDGKKIATTFWGKAWCDNLAAYSDYSNRLPRGATYVRNGSVVDLVIKSRLIEAIVAGSEVYTIKIEIDALAASTWQRIKKDCSASIDSLLDLLAGRFSDGVMQRLTNQKDGLFPSPREIKMKCSCPDWSDCCKHLAAVMYGIGARLDKQPELLFVLRDVDHEELVSQAVAEGNLDQELSVRNDASLAGEDLEAIFGIELDEISGTPQDWSEPRSHPSVKVARATKRKATGPSVKKTEQKSKQSGNRNGVSKLSQKLAAPAKPAVARSSRLKKSATVGKAKSQLKKTTKTATSKTALPKRAPRAKSKG